MLTAPTSIWEHVESQFFSKCNADIFPSNVTPCARQLLCSHSPIENVLAQRVSQYNSVEKASVGVGVGEVSPATSRDQLNTTRWRFYDGQDWDTGHWTLVVTHPSLALAPDPPPDHILTRAPLMPQYLTLSTKHPQMCWLVVDICRNCPAKT